MSERKLQAHQGWVSRYSNEAWKHQRRKWWEIWKPRYRWVSVKTVHETDLATGKRTLVSTEQRDLA